MLNPKKIGFPFDCNNNFLFWSQMTVAFGFPYDQSIAIKYRIMWSFFPPNLLAQALNMFTDASSKPEGVGISWGRRADCPPDDSDCVMTIVSTHFKSQYLNINLHQHSFPFIFYPFSTIYIFVPFL